MGILIFWIVIFAIVIWGVSNYNNLVALKLQTQNAWRQIDVQLKRRYDLIPNLVETVKGFMQFEQDTLTKVVEARSRAMASRGVKETAEAQSVLSESLAKVFAVMENYPDLKSNQNVQQLQEELTTTENQISFARQYYNDLVMRFNTKQESFPANIIAGFFKFEKADFYVIPEKEKETPKVNLALAR